ncbi:MAG: phosphatidate cytidylyltransferase [Chitinispirillaceae bacterium]|jgi:CDP-diglyceride synthetase|nr:phosphatidate cytidylyltransferase [Chitinispirillaceae bacterium]
MSLPNIGKRLMFALPAGVLGWVLVNATISLTPPGFPPVYPGHLVGLVLAFLACYEYNNLLKALYLRNGFWLMYFWLGLQFYLNLTDNKLPHNVGIYLLLMLTAIEAFIWGRPRGQRRWVRASLLFSGTLFLYISVVALLGFYQPPFQSLFKSHSSLMLSQLGICLIIFSVTMCDTFAYLVGCTWGKHHFSTISPGKTIEGSIGGFSAAVIITAVGWWFLAEPEYPRAYGIILGVLIGVFAQLGDLLVSLMKRYFRVKDASDLIPGHGGILDRFGSLFFTAPVISLFVWFVHL